MHYEIPEKDYEINSSERKGICLDKEGPNWTVYSFANGIPINKNIYTTPSAACINVIERTAPDKLTCDKMVESFKNLTSALI